MGVVLRTLGYLGTLLHVLHNKGRLGLPWERAMPSRTPSFESRDSIR